VIMLVARNSLLTSTKVIFNKRVFCSRIEDPNFFHPINNSDQKSLEEVHHGRVPTVLDVATIISDQISANNKASDPDQLFPRHVRIEAIIMEMKYGAANHVRPDDYKQPPTGFTQDNAQWRMQIKTKFLAHMGRLYTNKDLGDITVGTTKEVIALESLFAEITKAHLDPVSGIHYGRDKMYHNTLMASLSKEVCAKYIKVCPTCSPKVAACQAAYNKNPARGRKTKGYRSPPEKAPLKKRQRQQSIDDESSEPELQRPWTPVAYSEAGLSQYADPNQNTNTSINGTLMQPIEDQQSNNSSNLYLDSNNRNSDAQPIGNLFNNTHSAVITAHPNSFQQFNDTGGFSRPSTQHSTPYNHNFEPIWSDAKQSDPLHTEINHGLGWTTRPEGHEAMKTSKLPEANQANISYSIMHIAPTPEENTDGMFTENPQASALQGRWPSPPRTSSEREIEAKDNTFPPRETFTDMFNDSICVDYLNLEKLDEF
jgi:hypothetical protein